MPPKARPLLMETSRREKRKKRVDGTRGGEKNKRPIALGERTRGRFPNRGKEEEDERGRRVSVQQGM